jgi:hypothetical protein
LGVERGVIKPTPKNILVTKFQPKPWNGNQGLRRFWKGFGFGTWNVRTMFRPGPKCRDRDVKRMLRCRNWRRSAEDRQAWRRRFEEAKAQVWL